MTDSTTQTSNPKVSGPLEITVTDAVHGTADQSTLDAWELRQARIALALLKEKLGHEAIVELLAPEIAASDERFREYAAASNGEWGPLVESTFRVRGLTPAQFMTWFAEHLVDEPAMIAANPDHYEIRNDVGVITETMGGLPVRFQMHVGQTKEFMKDSAAALANLRSDAKSRPTDNPGHSTLMDGVTPVARAVKMDFDDLDDGFQMTMGLRFPAAAPEAYRVDHLRHYAIEFSRWLTMAYEAAQAS